MGKEFQNFNTEAIQKYITSHKERIEFFKYMQFEAERQFDLAHQTAVECGMRLGFYRDLPVGVNSESTEVWSDPELFIPGVGAGAPPDAFFLLGKNGVLAPLTLLSSRKNAISLLSKSCVPICVRPARCALTMLWD